MSEHTQGRATWRAGRAEADGTRVVNSTDGTVAWVPAVWSSVASNKVTADEAHRRAVLMAASEDLLAALQKLREDAVVLSREYLDTFSHYPMDAPILGWEKGQWLRAIEAYENAGAVIDRVTGGKTE